MAKCDNIVAASLADTVRRQITLKRTDYFEDDIVAHKAAVGLWNLVLRSERDVEKTYATVSAEYMLLLLLSRVFAFVIMHDSTCPDMSTISSENQLASSMKSQVLYLMGIAIRAARACIGEQIYVFFNFLRPQFKLTSIAKEQTEMGRLVLEHVATYTRTLDRLFASPGDGSDARQKAKFVQLKNDYVMLQFSQVCFSLVAIRSLYSSRSIF